MEAYTLGGAGARQINWSVFFSQVSSQFGSSGLSASLIAKYFWICGTKTERRKHLQSLFIRWAHRSSWQLCVDVTRSRQGDDGSTNYSNAVGFCNARAAWLPWPPMLLPGVRCLKVLSRQKELKTDVHERRFLMFFVLFVLCFLMLLVFLSFCIFNFLFALFALQS